MKNPTWTVKQEVPPMWIFWIYLSEYERTGMEFKGA